MSDRTANLLWLCVVCTGSCVDTAPPPAITASADTTAVINVDYPPPGSVPVWELSARPDVSIGQTEGPTEHLLCRVSAVLRPPGGVIAIADGSRTIRFFSHTGALLRSIGRPGEGPGEFRVIKRMRRYGTDSLIVWDHILRRATIIGIHGGGARTISGPGFDTDRFYFFVEGFFSDGSMLATVSEGIQPETERVGIRRNVATYLHVDLRGVVDTVGQFADSESYISEDRSVTGMPFGRQAVLHPAHAEFHYGFPDSYEIRTYTEQGELRRILRVNRDPAPLTRATVDAHIEQQLAWMTDTNRRRRQAARYAALQFPQTLPSYRTFKGDSEGNLWVQDYNVDDERPDTWTIFDAQGRIIARLESPPRISIHEIGADYVLGLERSADDVERVVQYALIKTN